MVATDPRGALELVRQHVARFDRPILGSERMLVEIAALHRLGQRDQAQALAKRLLASRGGGLYRERLERLLGDEHAGP